MGTATRSRVIAGSRFPGLRTTRLIGDCHSAALISKQGSIDWCCMRRLDAGSVFGRLLDWNHGGHCALRPTGEYEASRVYGDDSLILETTFHSDRGEARLLDFFAMREGGRERPRHQLIRIVEGVRGRVEFRLSIVPRFDYASFKPWLRQHAERALLLGWRRRGIALHV